MEKVTLIKVGGKLLDTHEGQKSIVNQILKIPGKKIVVHGGGVLINNLCERLEIETKMVNGRRITSKQNMDVVLMTCAGKLNKELVSQINYKGIEAIGLCGADLNMIQSQKRNVLPIDFGYVGDITKVNTKWLKVFIDNDIIPVISSITQSISYELLNTNADSIASALASALSIEYSVELFYFFDKKGVLLDVNDNKSIIENLTYKKYLFMKQNKCIHEGMLPKLDNGFLALNRGVKKVLIGNKQNEGTILSI